MITLDSIKNDLKTDSQRFDHHLAEIERVTWFEACSEIRNDDHVANMYYNTMRRLDDLQTSVEFDLDLSSSLYLLSERAERLYFHALKNSPHVKDWHRPYLNEEIPFVLPLNPEELSQYKQARENYSIFVQDHQLTVQNSPAKLMLGK